MDFALFSHLAQYAAEPLLRPIAPYRVITFNSYLTPIILFLCALTPAISAPRHPTKPENTKSLRGAGALDRVVRQRFSEDSPPLRADPIF